MNDLWKLIKDKGTELIYTPNTNCNINVIIK